MESDLTISRGHKYGFGVWHYVKSDDCVNNAHGLCKGFIKETVESSTITKMCVCPCHDSMYQLIRNSIAVVNSSQRNNPYQFTTGDDI